MGEEAFRLGTRGSALALRQAGAVKETLAANRFDVELVEVTTAGDRVSDELVRRLGRTGAFVRDIDERVLAGELDGAVHSLKDMPTEMPEELIVAAIPERARAHDVLVTPDGRTLGELPSDATVGTSSLRRAAQIRRVRPDVAVEPIRGNVDTRLAKLLAGHLQRERAAIAEADEDGALENWLAERDDLERRALDRDVETEYDALVLAAAGLERAGLTDAAPLVELPLDRFVPAPGQGANAVTMRDTEPAERIHRHLDHPPSRVAVTVERTVLSSLGGGCIAPIGVNAIVQGEMIRTLAHVLGRDGEQVIEMSRELPVKTHAEAAIELAEDLAEEGATELIAAAKRDADEGPDPP